MSGWDETLWTSVGDGQFYLHLFDASQPDLNWDNKEVQDDFLKTLEFWGDRGVAGFRVDVAQGLKKDLSMPFMLESEVKERQGWVRKNGKEKNYHPYMDRCAQLSM
jgi:alpha-glucosidase